MVGKEIKYDKQSADKALKNANSIRTQLTGENTSKRKSGMLNAFTSITGAKVEVIQEIKTKTEWEEYIKNNE